ncbi:SdrD B-like domain-containing protein [Arthrobacter sp. HY1533]|uniref:SdrD B-like domain-containing protein n=1 Tax=Arthrobacter sp. HY1533 TaxID=2970919 RepID=UPI0022B9DEBB|nr:SdrD B-like domain-containing protein [Arthrobacter sp. HY1533]
MAIASPGAPGLLVQGEKSDAGAKAGGDGMALTKTLTTAGPVGPGDEVTYELIVGCTGLTEPCADATLVDVLPAPLVLKKVTTFGFKKPVTQDGAEGDNRVKLTFNEVFPDGEGTGLNDGADYSVTITAKLPAALSPEWDGAELTNTATLTSKAGEVTDEADPVGVKVDAAPGASISKAWAKDSVLEGSGQDNALTLGGIKNTSKVGATSLTIVEPTGGTDPFAAVAFTGFGNIVYPEGADRLQVSYTIAGEVKKLTAAPNAPPAFPAGTDFPGITGFEFTFSSSASTAEKGGIAANGAAGSIVLQTKLRDGAKPAPADKPVKNKVSISAETPKGNSQPAFAEDSFVIVETNYAIAATKSFTPKFVVAGDEASIGDGKNRSTVKIGAVNGSNQPLKTMSIKEPASGTAPFGNGIDFEKFISGTWPAGATSGQIIIAGTPYELTNNNGQLKFPAGLPAGKNVTSFEIGFAGEFAPGSGFALDFSILGTTARTEAYSNTILASGDPLAGGPAVENNATDSITVVDPKETLIGAKAFSPATVEGIKGDTTTAILDTKVDGAPTSTNVDVRKIVQTDIFLDDNPETHDMYPAWKATGITVDNSQKADNVLVEYRNSAGAWVVLKDAALDKERLILEGKDVTGVRVTYTRGTGSFPHGQNVVSKVDFELQDLAAEKFVFSNTLGINNGKDSTGTVTVDKVMKLGSGKSWGKTTIVQKPSDMNPTNVLRLNAVNASTYPVDSLTLVDPKAGGVNPFNYVNITGFTATLRAGVNPATANLEVTFDGGATASFTGGAALKPVLTDGKSWADVVGFRFSLLPSGQHKVIRGAGFDLTVPTSLRDRLRTDDSKLIDVALSELDPKYSIPNTATSTIKRAGDPDVSEDKSAPVKVITKNSVVIKPVLTKSFDPAGALTFFPENGTPKPVTVSLNLNTGTDAADKIVIEDVDETFWNAFDFAGWNPVPASNGKVTIEYFSGAVFTTDNGNVKVQGGTWATKAPANADVQGLRVTMQGNDYEPLNKTVNVVKFNVLPRYTLRTGELNSIDGQTSNPGEADNATKSTVENDATATVERLGKGYGDLKDEAEYQFIPGKSKAGVTKDSNANPNGISAGEAVNYTIQVSNSGTEAILNPTITDKLPKDAQGLLLQLDDDWVSQLSYDFKPKFLQAPPGTSMTKDADLVKAELRNGNEITFSFPAGTKLYPGESYTIVIPVTVRAGLRAGTDLTNQVEFGGEKTDTAGGEAKVNLIEGQAYASRKLVREVPVEGQTAPTGVHNVKTGVENDKSCYDFGGGFYRYPCVVETKPGGTAEWKLSVANTGNVDAQHLEILDIFPFPGDTGVTSTQNGKSRESQWTPILLDVKLPVVPAETKMVLSYLTGDPATCKPNGKNKQDPWAGCDTNWVIDRPANPKEIRGIKLVMDFPQGLEPNGEVSLTFTTQSATEMPEGVQALAPAWNSFGYHARAIVNGKADYRSQEPIKTGITFRPVPAEKVSVGDHVWIDEDKDGRQDEDEPGIKDVVLTIAGPDGKPVTDVFGNPVLPTMTDGDGQYTFDNLPVLKDGESYTVSIDREASAKPLAPYHPTKPGQGDREGDSSSWTATSEGLGKDGDRDPSLDFGFVLTPGKVSVGDYVWVDTNRDGVQGDPAKEPGIKDVVLTIAGPDGKPVTDVFGNVVEPVKTDKDGKYSFENLPVLKDGESYTVSIDKEKSKDPLAPYIPTVDTGADRGTNSSTWTATSEGLTQDGQRDPSLDFGFVLPKVSVGDYVWVDTNRDGVQGDPAKEPGIKDVVLTIAGPDGKPVTDVFGNVVEPVKTDEKGKYTFENLPVLKDGESYTVSIDKEKSKDPLAPYIPTVDTGADRGTNSSTWTATSEGLTQDGQRDPSLDFGFVLPKVSVGDYVWVDTNRDGVQGDPAKEPGIKDVVLTIAGPDGKPVTDVFGNVVEPVKTDEKGKYTFENLPVLKDGESYTVSIDKEKSKDPLAPYIPTVDTGADRGTNSSTWTATSEGLTQDGQRDPSLDFGFVLPKVSAGDYVWVDTNRDGVQDEGEKGIKDVVLVITAPDGKPVTDVFGNVVEPIKTDENGKYSFGNLPVLKDGESYTVSIDKEASKDPLAPYIPTVQGSGNLGTDSSDWTTTSTGLTQDGQHDPSLDFGFVLPKVSVGDYVWVDTNRDGLQSEGEKGIKDVVLTIAGPDGKPVVDVFGNVVEPVTTDENGQYTFENLPVLKDGESYTVSIDKEKSKDPLAPYIPTVETEGNRGGDSSTWSATSEGLTQDGQRDPSLDFGFVLPKVSVGDYVWVDTDRDGVQGDPAKEPGIKDVVLTIAGPDGKPVVDVFGNVVEPVKTDKDGKYSFENLPVLKDGESYTVSIDKEASKDPLAPYIPTVDTGVDRGTNSSTWTATSEGLGKDRDRDASLDFGFVLPKVSVGDYVWVDSNSNGRQDAGEPGIKDVVLTIAGPDGKPVVDVFGNVVEPVKTDKDGKYSFENLPVLKDGESYTVTIDRKASANALAPYQPTTAGQGDRTGDSSTWTATSEGLSKDGERDPSLDFGFVLLPVPATTAPAAGNLSNTGFDGPVLMAMGLLLTMLGGGAVALTARRRRQSPARH